MFKRSLIALFHPRSPKVKQKKKIDNTRDRQIECTNNNHISNSPLKDILLKYLLNILRCFELYCAVWNVIDFILFTDPQQKISKNVA